MRRIDKAVILAAGSGNRISRVARGVPKPLLPIDGGETTFLDWHLAALARAGAREIYLVGNQVTFGTKLRGLDGVDDPPRVEWILNPTTDLSTSGSGHSTQYAWASPHAILDGKSRVILMDADILYEPELLERIAAAPGPASKTLVCSAYRHTHEEVLVFARAGEPETPVVHGKGLLGTGLVDGLVCVGEATGILLFEPEDHALVRAATDWCIGFSTARARSEHEDITQRMMMQGRMRTVSFGAEHLFMECDTPDEYEVLTREMYPALRARIGD
jgi:choline kinase